MIKRKLSSLDLLDLITTYPYHSPASISAMSRAALNRLLVEPSSIVDDATVCGKTAIATVGIVFTNSGTRVSANGRAFSILSIGNLNTGPVLTVFLFGDAYSGHTTTCRPGTVIAILAPNMVPPKDGSSDRSISFSVNDKRQLVLVANARDYGTCKGTVKGRQVQGKWVPNAQGGSCKNYVDTRVSQYCQTHRKQAHVKSGKVDKNKGTTFVKKLKMEGNTSQVSQQPSRRVSAELQSQLATSGIMTMDMPSGPVITHIPQNGMNEAAAGKPRLRAPLHMKKSNAHKPPPSLSSSTNQLTGRKRQPLQQSNSVARDWLNAKKSTTQKHPPTKRRAVNLDGGHFSGSVAIPKPSKLFQSAGTRPAARAAPVARQSLTDNQRSSIMENQKLVAEKLREGSNRGSLQAITQSRRGASSSISGSRFSSSSTRSDQASLEKSLFGGLGKVDTEKIMAAKSRFASEADAEAYARRRQVVTDLERREERKNSIEESKKKAAGLSGKESQIKKEWFCKTCNRKFLAKPKGCIRAKHQVKFEREVKARDSVAEKRLELGTKSVEEGGIVLGAGLEWDRRRNFST